MVSGVQFEEQRAPVVALTRQHGLEDGELMLLGAHESATGAMTRIELSGHRLLVDCGMPQGAEAYEWALDESAADVDAIVLTSGHLDHIGSLPELFARGFSGPIYGTPATLAMARWVLAEALGREALALPEGGRVLAELEQRGRPLRYSQRAELGSVELVLHDAGHVVGSASVELTSPKSRVICSGSLGRPGEPLLGSYNTEWRSGRPVDLVLMESTYGDQEHAHGYEALEKELERILIEAADRGGNVLVPAFAIGRAQTLLHCLTRLLAAGRVPFLPLAFDGALGMRIVHDPEELRPLIDRDRLAAIARGDEPLGVEDLYAVRHEPSQRLSLMPGPMIIIAGHAMCTGGRIVNHLRRLIPHEQTTVLFIGHQPEGTPGRGIQRAAPRGGRVWLDHEEVRVRAHVETLGGFSGHADRRELARWLNAIPEVRRVALHHGAPKAQRAFAAWYA